jgi:heme exporter protein C
MAQPMVIGLLLMTGACWAYSVAVALARVRCLIEERQIVEGGS